MGRDLDVTCPNCRVPLPEAVPAAVGLPGVKVRFVVKVCPGCGFERYLVRE